MSVWATNLQAAQIDALIVRASQLSPVERDRLVAALDAALDADRDAARDAARDMARDEDWAADRVADRVAAAAGDAAWAAEALVVRDLIDEATAWNQAAYDVLTGPWRRAIGPIHPDDEVLS